MARRPLKAFLRVPQMQNVVRTLEMHVNSASLEREEAVGAASAIYTFAYEEMRRRNSLTAILTAGPTEWNKAIPVEGSYNMDLPNKKIQIYFHKELDRTRIEVKPR